MLKLHTTRAHSLINDFLNQSLSQNLEILPPQFRCTNRHEMFILLLLLSLPPVLLLRHVIKRLIFSPEKLHHPIPIPFPTLLLIHFLLFLLKRHNNHFDLTSIYR